MPEIVDCWCATCDQMLAEAATMNGNWLAAVSRVFIVCRDCGNKRCPRAWHHDNDCTGSNDVGQRATRNGVPVAAR